jgi:DNA-binding NarL/FixJ family response regulator
LNTVPGIRCVGTVATAAEGIAMAAELQPDIVAIDIRLPCGDDGPAVTRRIKEVAPDAVAVITSAYRDPEWVSRAAQAGASAFLPKTGSLSDMLDVLRRIRPGS